ncbi:hypothetical protein C4556_02505 [Candidatus Parcubacteria bacterium]|nr:MAG: hypothetical protein C4556_02505 [Candidatus Parcubacteria bacterium]
MLPRIFLYAQLVTLVFLATLHLVGLEYHFYWRFLWLDTVSHALGGMWAAFFLLWIRAYAGYIPTVAWGIAGALILGVIWEAFELLAGLVPEANYALDTSIDLLMDALGGALAAWIAHSFARSK